MMKFSPWISFDTNLPNRNYYKSPILTVNQHQIQPKPSKALDNPTIQPFSLKNAFISNHEYL